MRLGVALRQARKRAGLSQEQAAYWAEVSREHISDVERLKHEPRLSLLRRLADAYGVTVSMLLGEEPMRLDCLTRKERAVIELMRSQP